MKHVLIVDDDEDFREALRAALNIRGFTVELAANGREALVRLGSPHRPEVVLVDLMMPVMSGQDLLAAMKANPELACIPAVVVSAATNLGSVPGAVAVLPKPCDLETVVQFIESPTGAK